jgi:hypothetical protein
LSAVNTVTVAIWALAPCGGSTVTVPSLASVAANGVVTAACRPSKKMRLSGVSPAAATVVLPSGFGVSEVMAGGPLFTTLRASGST